MPAESPLRIGILTFNGLHHTRRCITSLQAHTERPWTLLVRDNGSTDETASYLRALTDPRIRVHLGAENLGVGGGRNWLMSELVPHMADDDLLVLCDNDIEMARGWEVPFVEAFRARPRLGVAGRWAFSMRVRPDGRDILAEHGADSGPVDTVQGCMFVVRGAAARDVGSFDEKLGRFWHEDDDYSVRALHAGWDVRRIHTDAVLHHEHGSGAALDPKRMAGSVSNQQYLAQKWHRLGAIDEHGVPRRPEPEDHAPLIGALSARLGRRLLRTEVNSALVDAAKLLDSDVSDACLGPMLAPAVRLLLQDVVVEGGSPGAAAERVLDRGDALLARRRANSAAPGPFAARAFNAVCSPHAWDDARWEHTCVTHLRDGSGRDYYARSEGRWRDTQLLHTLLTLGALRGDARVLFAGSTGEPLIAALSGLGHAPEIWECDASGASFSPRAGSFDVVLCPNLTQYASADQVPRRLTELAGLARAGAVVAAGASVCIAGPRDGRWLEIPQLAHAATLQEAGLALIGSMPESVCDETLLAAVPEDAPPTCRPRLARWRPPHCLTMATLVARKR